jgi:hypothetical protein
MSVMKLGTVFKIIPYPIPKNIVQYFQIPMCRTAWWELFKQSSVIKQSSS